MSFLRFAGLVVAMVFSFFTSARAQDVDAHQMLAQGKWLNVTRPLTAADMQGRLVLLDFWTYGCVNCMQVVPDLEYLEQTFGDKLLIVGVHSAKFQGEQGDDRILAAAQRFGLKHPVINDASFAIWKSFDVHAWPTLVLLGADGQEIERYSGEGHRAALADAISGALKKTTAVAPLSDVVAKQDDNNILSFPARLELAKDTPWGDVLFIADSGHHRIVAAGLDGQIKVVIGSGDRGAKDGNFETASFNRPRGIAMMNGALYVADTDNHLIRRVDLKTKTVTTIAGTGQRGVDHHVKNAAGLKTAMASPWDVEPMGDGKTLAVAMAGLHQILALDTKENTLSVMVGSGWEELYDGGADTSALAQPSGLSFQNGMLYFVDAESSSLRVYDPATDTVKTLVGTGLFDFGLVDGLYPTAMMQHAQGLFAAKDRIWVADTYNNLLRFYDLKAKAMFVLPTTGAVGLHELGDVVVDDKGKAFIADTNAHGIKTVDLATGEMASFVLQDMTK
jgi:thiol-disulfide isomerase/thioredoxin